MGRHNLGLEQVLMLSKVDYKNFVAAVVVMVDYRKFVLA